MYQFAMHGVCAQIKSDEDLSVIENAEDFVDSFHVSTACKQLQDALG